MAIFSQHEMVASSVKEVLSIEGIKELTNHFPGTDRAILSKVASVDPSVIEYLRKNFKVFLELNHQTAVPMRNSYLTPETLGLDRIAAAIGARELFPDQVLLVIDAGTAVTFDLVESDGTFAGGNISPGLRSRFRALHEFTGNLPWLEAIDQFPMIGKTTEEAIQSGVTGGMVMEIDGMIDSLKKKYPEIQSVLTGGDALFFERRLKNHIFVKFEITLIGLNRILEYNVEKQ
jgi:type III pantothenate kinase